MGNFEFDQQKQLLEPRGEIIIHMKNNLSLAFANAKSVSW